MGRNKDDSIRKLTKIGKSSYAVTLPMDVIRAFGWRAKQKLHSPLDKLLIFAVTGTDGKTTTANMVYHILTQSGRQYFKTIFQHTGIKQCQF